MAAILLQCSECAGIFQESDAFNHHKCCQSVNPTLPEESDKKTTSPHPFSNDNSHSSAKTFYVDGEPVGPISSLIPQRYHRYASRDVLKSYLTSNLADAEAFSKRAGVADIPVITKKKVDTVYKHILDNLTEGGKEAVNDIQPWIFNTLVDWSQLFEEFVCSNVKPDPNQSQSMEKTSEVKSWSKQAAICLIELHTKYQNLFQKPSMKKKDIWLKISNEMKESNFNFSSSQCEQKWKNLTKAYRDTVDHNRKSGNDRKKECAFYHELEECLGYRPNVNPVYTMGSSHASSSENSLKGGDANKTLDATSEPKRQKFNDVTTFLNTSVEEQEVDSSMPVCKPRRSSTNDEIMKFLGSMKEDQTDLIKTIKEQHTDRMENEKRKIDLMEKLVVALSKN